MHRNFPYKRQLIFAPSCPLLMCCSFQFSIFKYYYLIKFFATNISRLSVCYSIIFFRERWLSSRVTLSEVLLFRSPFLSLFACSKEWVLIARFIACKSGKRSISTPQLHLISGKWFFKFLLGVAFLVSDGVAVPATTTGNRIFLPSTLVWVI